MISQRSILTRDEIKLVVRCLRKRANGGSGRAARNLLVFRLALGCGLRATEIAKMQMHHVHVDNGDRPNIEVHFGKGGKKREVPLWWDRGTLEDVRRWKHGREKIGAKPEDLLVLTENGTSANHMHIWRWWKSALSPLGVERRSEVRLHDGRHAFGSYAVQHHSLAAVRDVMGHSSIRTTNIYLHVIDDDDGEIKEMWET